MSLELCSKYLKVLLRKEKADLVFKNGFVINVFTKEIVKSDVAICNGIIIGVGEFDGKDEIDVSGKYLSPGFVDSHIHFESTLLSPSQMIEEASLCGTTTYIADPHEVANVCGAKGIDYILEDTKSANANVLIMLPSCVPSIKTEDNGCVFDSEKMKHYLDNHRILGLGEVIDLNSVLNLDEEIHKKINMFEICDGHCPNFDAKQLNAYKLFGICTDHECIDFEQALEEARLGMQVHIRV